MNKDVCIYTKLLPCVGYRSLSGTFLHTVGISPHYYGNRQRMKECVRAREKERRKERKCAACINYSSSLTQTYMAWLQLLTCTHTLSLLHTHMHNLLSILGMPSVSHPQHPLCTVNIIVQFWQCGLAENTERKNERGKRRGNGEERKAGGEKRTTRHSLCFSPKWH